MHRPVLLLVALASIALPAFADDPGDTGPTKLTPLQIGAIFCITRVGNDMAPVEAILTPGLKKAIARADAAEASWEKHNPGEKPPLGDGLPWQAHPDYTTQCSADHPVEGKLEARVNISYAFADDPKTNYTDTLVLKPIPDANIGDSVWRLDDVVFADSDSLRKELVSAFKP